MFEINKKVKDAYIARNIRFTEDLFAELNATAGQFDVSLNALVLQCCRYALDNLNSEEKNTITDGK